MRQVEATIEPHLLADVKERLCLVGVRGLTIHPVAVFGGAREPPTSRPFCNFIRMKIVAPEDLVETIVNAIMTVARRASGSDGQILITPMEAVLRIRTGETDREAL
jgi:nitrogen regulatory protein PII